MTQHIEVVAASTELLELLPRLGEALERDRTPSTGGRIRTPRVPDTPVNSTVLDTITDLRTDIPTVDLRARQRLDGATEARDPMTCVAAAVAIHQQLHSLDPNHATTYADALHRWHHTARHALGLDQPAARLGSHCPLHDQPRTPLLVAGDRATHHHVPPGTRPAITWHRGDAIWCPHCRTTWKPPHWLLLGRLIQDTTCPA